jgi:hypothetical protein
VIVKQELIRLVEDPFWPIRIDDELDELYIELTKRHVFLHLMSSEDIANEIMEFHLLRREI